MTLLRRVFLFSESDPTIFLTFEILRPEQLNQEAVALDWTKAAGHTLSGARFVEEDDAPMDIGGVTSGHKLGGSLRPSADVRSTAALAAIMRYDAMCAGTSLIFTEAHLR